MTTETPQEQTDEPPASVLDSERILMADRITADLQLTMDQFRRISASGTVNNTESSTALAHITGFFELVHSLNATSNNTHSDFDTYLPPRSALSLIDYDALSELQDRIDKIRSGLQFNDLLQEFEVMNTTLLAALEEFDYLDAEQYAGREVTRRIAGIIEPIRDQLRLRNALRRSEQAADLAERSAQHAQEASGETGRESMAAHFGIFAKREQRTANVLRNTVIIVALIVTLVAAWFLVRGGQKLTWIDFARRVSVGIPLAALAAYLGRESSKHRQKADWAASIEVQLRTVNAFTEPLADSLKQEIRGAFGKAIFGAPLTPHKLEQTSTEPSVQPNNIETSSALADLIQKVITPSAGR